MKKFAPFEHIYQTENGHLVSPETGEHTLYCPTCLRPVVSSASGPMLPHVMQNGLICVPSPTVIITKAIIQCISAGQRVFVRPVMDGQRKVVPALVVAPLGLAVNSYINTAYEPAGAIWKSPKGSRMGVFFMPDRAGQVNKVLFDYIAVINPEIFIPYFKECWATGEHDNPLTLLNTLLMSTNAAAEWIKWPDKNNSPKWSRQACINAVRSYAKYNKPIQSGGNCASVQEVTTSSS